MWLNITKKLLGTVPVYCVCVENRLGLRLDSYYKNFCYSLDRNAAICLTILHLFVAYLFHFVGAFYFEICRAIQIWFASIEI